MGNYRPRRRYRRRSPWPKVAVVVLCLIGMGISFWLLAGDDLKPPKDDQSQTDDTNKTDPVTGEGDKTETPGDVPGSSGTPDDQKNPAPEPEPDPEPEPEPAVDPYGRGDEPVPDPKQGSRPWNLTLVNPWNEVPDSWEPSLTTVWGWNVDSRMADDLQRMLEDCSANSGSEPVLCSTYRTWDMQTTNFNNTVASYQNSYGMSYEDAIVAAATETAVPGTSEHQLGLAVDIVDITRQWLDDGQADTPVQQWLMANCYRYGFILRYEREKQPITGIIYEPWHYRYVGEYAEAIHTSGLCLEEWLAQN